MEIDMYKFTFWANSVEGLIEDVEVFAHTYADALHRVMKHIYLDKTDKHEPRGTPPSCWE